MKIASVKSFANKALDIFEALLLLPLLVLIFFVSLFVSLPDIGNLLTQFISVLTGGSQATFQTTQLMSLVLPILSLLTLVSLRNNFQTEKEFDETRNVFQDHIRVLIDSVHGVEYVSFDSDLELKRHLNTLTRNARRQIADLTWAHKRPEQHPTMPQRNKEEQTEWERLEDEHGRIVTEMSQTHNYREIFVLSRKDRIEKLRMRLRENSPRYFCRTLEEANIPRMQFVIVDNEEVVFVSSNHKVLCSIKHRGLVQLFLDYFDDAWQMGSELVSMKNGVASWNSELVENVIEQAAKHLEKQTN